MTFEQKLMQAIGRAAGFIKPWVHLAGVALAAALAIDAFVYAVPGVSGDQGTLLLAALLVFAGR